MSERIEKVFKGPNQTIPEEHSHFTRSWRKWRLETRNLLLSKVLLLKVCELKDKTPSLLGKVTILLTQVFQVWSLLMLNTSLWLTGPPLSTHQKRGQSHSSSVSLFFRSAWASCTTGQPVHPPARPRWKSGHLYTGIYASRIIRRLIRPTLYSLVLPSTV